MSILFCDSNCELWHDTAKELNLQVIKMPYILDGEEYYYDLGEKTDFKHFYGRMRARSAPTTAALNTYNYIEYFEPFLKQGEDILYLTFSHKMSATFTFMNEAIATLKEKYPSRSIRFFDTKGISMGAGYQVYYAAKMKQAGKNDDEILTFLADFTSRVSTYFVVDDLNHLKRGGRISTAKAVMGTMLGIKPLISLQDDGSLENIGKIKGAKKVMSEFVQLVKAKGRELDKYAIWVLHADCEEQGKELAAKLKQEISADLDIKVQMVGPVIATHCGPGALAIIFHSDSRN